MIPTKPQDVIWTDAQWQSIYAKGQDILVAAAAGCCDSRQDQRRRHAGRGRGPVQ